MMLLFQFFSYYTFYEGRDSVGSAGYNMYVSHETANALGIVNVTLEADELDVYNTQRRKRQRRRSCRVFNVWHIADRIDIRGELLYCGGYCCRHNEPGQDDERSSHQGSRFPPGRPGFPRHWGLSRGGRRDWG